MGLYPCWVDGCNVTARHEFELGDNFLVTDVIRLIVWIKPRGGPMRANVIPQPVRAEETASIGRPRGHQATRPALHGDVRMRMAQAAGRRDAN